MTEPPRYPGYDVLAKRDTPSWNAVTRRVIDERLATPDMPRFFSTGRVGCRRRAVPPHRAAAGEDRCGVAGRASRRQAARRSRRRLSRGGHALYARSLATGACRDRRRGAGAERWAKLYRTRPTTTRTRCCGDAAAAKSPVIAGPELDAKSFFERRILVDVPALYYSHPKAWNEIGFGGPASPRGYVRLDGDRPDPWEAAEADARATGNRCERKNRHVV